MIGLRPPPEFLNFYDDDHHHYHHHFFVQKVERLKLKKVKRIEGVPAPAKGSRGPGPKAAAQARTVVCVRAGVKFGVKPGE